MAECPRECAGAPGVWAKIWLMIPKMARGVRGSGEGPKWLLLFVWLGFGDGLGKICSVFLGQDFGLSLESGIFLISSKAELGLVPLLQNYLCSSFLGSRAGVVAKWTAFMFPLDASEGGSIPFQVPHRNFLCKSQSIRPEKILPFVVTAKVRGAFNTSWQGHSKDTCKAETQKGGVY